MGRVELHMGKEEGPDATGVTGQSHCSNGTDPAGVTGQSHSRMGLAGCLGGSGSL